MQVTAGESEGKEEDGGGTTEDAGRGRGTRDVRDAGRGIRPTRPARWNDDRKWTWTTGSTCGRRLGRKPIPEQLRTARSRAQGGDLGRTCHL